MEKKKTKGKLSILWAFLFGIILMLGVYILFESAPNRLRSGSDDDTEIADTITDSVADSLNNIMPTGGVDDQVEEVIAVPSVFLGVEVLSVNSIIAEQLSLPSDRGVLVNGVVAGSPAQAAGLQRTDAILSLDGDAVEDIDGFRKLLAAYNAGDKVRITYVRAGKKDMTYAQLAAMPDSLAATQDTDSADSDWGVSLSDISSTLRGSLDIPADIDGVAILSVIPGGTADEAGLQPGDVITGIDQTPVTGMDELFTALSEDNDNIALLDVYSQGSVRYVPLDSSGIVETADTTSTETQTLRQRMVGVLTGGIPFGDDDDEDDEEGPKGGKFAQDDDVVLTTDTGNRPTTVPGDENTGGTVSESGGTSSSSTGMNRPTEVPPGGTTNDTVLFIGLLILLILYLSYREYTRPAEAKKN
ncbi:PDZ domain-containing protein [Planctomycetota bacterium]